MRQMGYTSCKADPDLWLKAGTRPEDKVHYYTYILCYVDNILCIHHDPMSVMVGEINKYLPLKPSSVGDPDIYLNAKLKEVHACRCAHMCARPAGTGLNTSDNDNNPHTTTHNSHQFLCKFHRPLKAVGVLCTLGRHAVA
jgi:hypothetical protein